MVVDRWGWLGDHLAADLANTVRRRGMRDVDLIRGPEDLAEWLDRERGRLPVPARVDAAMTVRFREVRDRALRLLRAAATGRPLPARDVSAINEIALRTPTVALIGRLGEIERRVLGPAGTQSRLQAVLVAAVIDLLARPPEDLALCDAPGCGQIYRRGRANQQWCSHDCGNRARAARHRTRSTRAHGRRPHEDP